MARRRRSLWFAIGAVVLAVLVVAVRVFTPHGGRHRHRAPREEHGETLPTAPPLHAPDRLRVTFADVGQGDAALLESADGHAAAIDTGPPEGASHFAAVLRAHRVAHLDWVILTHPHLDHVGGAERVLDVATVDRVLDPEFPHEIVTLDRFLRRVQGLGVPEVRAERGASLRLGADVMVEILAPHAPFLAGTRNDPNSNSVVARVGVGAVHVLFTGDAERETEARLLDESATSLRADVLKVAHHGSRFASGAGFLDAVHPRWAVISCGAGNDYGHPHAETLTALSERGVTTFRTDLDGDVTATTDGTAIAFGTHRREETAAGF